MWYEILYLALLCPDLDYLTSNLFYIKSLRKLRMFCQLHDAICQLNYIEI